jgi:alpha-tubulin suppressor-like RCC1 family protein
VALGHPKPENIAKPQQIEKLAETPVTQISTGNHFSLAMTSDGRLMVWGRGEFGVLGCGNRQTAEPIENEIFRKICEGGSTKIQKIKSCQDFSSVLMDDGTLYSFGNNDEGVMGIGKAIGADLCEVVNTPTPLEFKDSKEEQVADFDLGETSSVILGTSGKVYQLGQRLFFSPQLVSLDYNEHPVRSVAAFAKGVGFVTEHNEIFTKGAFWPVQNEIDEDINTGVIKVTYGDRFNGKKIVEIGNRFGDVGYVLVEEGDNPKEAEAL